MGLAAWVLVVATVATASPDQVLERIRYVGTVSYSRVVIDLTGGVTHEIRSIPGDGKQTPVSRLVIDLQGARVGPEAREPLSIDDALMQRIRTGQFTRDTARVVLDLGADAEHRVFTLRDPYRVVIDLHGKGVSARRVGEIERFDSSRPSTPRPAPPAARAEVPTSPLLPVRAPPVAHRVRVVLDPGHGGKDPGAHGIGQVYEKDVVLAITRELAARLQRDPGLDVRLTRDDDRYVSLEDRTAFANAVEADLFVSIHANAARRRSVRGVEVYYLNNTNHRGTLRLAAMENGLRWTGQQKLQDEIPALDYILSDLRQTYKVEESRRLADRLGGSMVTRLRNSWSDVGMHLVKEGPFYVLVGAYMPCVLVEVSYLTNPTEGGRLATRSYRSAIAHGIYDGIRTYLRENRVAKNL